MRHQLDGINQPLLPGVVVWCDTALHQRIDEDAGGQEVARSFYLTAADGDKPYTFDRIMRGRGLHIDALCLSIIGGIQPGVLAEYVRQATGGGAGADGLTPPFWSDEHDCLMQDHGSFTVPAPMSADAWEAWATKQQAELNR